MTDITDALFNAKRALEKVPPCRFVREAYGFPKCQVHSMGHQYDGHDVCDRAGGEGVLRKALTDLLPLLTIKVEIATPRADA